LQGGDGRGGGARLGGGGRREGGSVLAPAYLKRKFLFQNAAAKSEYHVGEGLPLNCHFTPHRTAKHYRIEARDRLHVRSGVGYCLQDVARLLTVASGTVDGNNDVARCET
jgi:hypothetical protein